MINSMDNAAIDAVRDIIPLASPLFRDLFADWWKYEAPCRDNDVVDGPDDEARASFNEMMGTAPTNTADLALKVQASRIVREGAEYSDEDISSVICDLRGLSSPMQDMATAWIDRWQALGGSFGTTHDRDGLNGRAGRMIPMSYVWTPPEQHNPALRPHEWIMEEADHTGAAKMLESLLTLVPGLKQAVYDMAESKGLVLGGREAMRAELRWRGMIGDISDKFVDDMIQRRIITDLFARIKDNPEKLALFEKRMAEIGFDMGSVAA